jgi:hypothetical protein
MMKRALFLLGATGISFFFSLPANAVILVEPIITTPNRDILNTRSPTRLGPEYPPGFAAEYGVPDAPNNLLNETGRDISGLTISLEQLSYSNPDSTPPLENEAVQWGDADADGRIGFSNDPNLRDIFAEVTVNNNVISFSDGIIPDGTIFFDRIVTNPDLTPGNGIIPALPPDASDRNGPIRVSSFYTAAETTPTDPTPTTVPEPTTNVALTFFGICIVIAVSRRFLIMKPAKPDSSK